MDLLSSSWTLSLGQACWVLSWLRNGATFTWVALGMVVLGCEGLAHAVLLSSFGCLNFRLGLVTWEIDLSSKRDDRILAFEGRCSSEAVVSFGLLHKWYQLGCLGLCSQVLAWVYIVPCMLMMVWRKLESWAGRCQVLLQQVPLPVCRWFWPVALSNLKASIVSLEFGLLETESI